VALGGLATIAGIIWTLVLLEPARRIAHGAGPRVYGFDGSRYRLGGDLLTASLFPWAERRDVDPLEYPRAVDGEYRLRIQSEGDETDCLDSVFLLVVDHEMDSAVLPTTKGELVAVSHAQRPIRVMEGGADVAGEPRQRWHVEFGRPPGDRALLVLRVRNSEFA